MLRSNEDEQEEEGESDTEDQSVVDLMLETYDCKEMECTHPGCLSLELRKEFNRLDNTLVPITENQLGTQKYEESLQSYCLMQVWEFIQIVLWHFLSNFMSNPINLGKGSEWEVALTDISFPTRVYNVTDGEFTLGYIPTPTLQRYRVLVNKPDAVNKELINSYPDVPFLNQYRTLNIRWRSTSHWRSTKIKSPLNHFLLF